MTLRDLYEECIVEGKTIELKRYGNVCLMIRFVGK